MVDVKQLSKKEDMSQVLGCIMLKTELLFDRDYTLKPNYFIQEYALVFSCISNLIKQGVKHFDDEIISEYMQKHLSNFYDIYKDINTEGDFIKNILDGTKFNNLDYHYNQVKKMAYLRDISKNVDISFIYDISGEDKELNKEFDRMNFKEVVNKFKILINKIDETWTEENKDNKESMSSESISDDILDDVLEGNVEVGHKFPMGLEALTYIYRGQLPQKYNLNMAGSGSGKTRLSMLEAVNNSCEYMYDTSKNKWIYTGETKPTLFISTEVTIKSLITMIISFISGVEEWKIKRRKCNDEEKERIKKAREIFKRGNLHLEYISSFTLESLDALMQKYILTKDVEFLYFDYIQASASVIASVSKRSGNKSLGTDKVLEVFSTELKELANNYFLNFNTSSQINRGQDGERELGRTRGAYSLPDKFDNVMMSGKPTNKELKKFEDLNILEGFLKPNYTIAILKNRDGEHNDIILWYHLNKGNMRFTYLGCTDIEVSEEYELTIDKYVYESAKEE